MRDMHTLQDLRVWHWRELMRLRKKAKKQREHKIIKQADATGRRADWHLRCVQLLNEHVNPITSSRYTTAEQDDAEYKANGK